jgi:hypothetical protein
VRPVTVVLSAALLSTAFLAAPAQAAGGTLTASMNLQTGLATVVASSGFGAFAEEEELHIKSETPGGYTITLVGTPTHTLTAGANCIATTSTRVVCSSVTVVPKLAVSVNLATATGATTTAIIDGVYTPALTFTGGSGADYVQGGSAADEIYGGLGDDDLFGGPGDDKISGDAGGDNIDGEEGNDSVSGGADDDFVVGGDGFDSMTGGTGVDELDSEDGLQDTYVNCDNAPGLGKIDFDKGLDIPYDCPVVLPPTTPLDLTAAGGKDSITVSWAPPTFDGNSQELTYEIAYKVPGAGTNAPKPIVVPGTETSYTLNNLAKSGLYYISMRSVNEKGASATTLAVPVVVGGAPSPPQSVSSVYISRGDATLSWVEPMQEKTPTYEVALRVKDKRNRNWLAWQSLPGRHDESSMEVGDDLRIVNGRVYQFRVRTVTGDGQTSAWVASPIRYVGNLTAPTNGTLEKVTLSSGKPAVRATFDLEGLAWTYNVQVTDVLAAYVKDAYYAVSTTYAKPNGTTYTWPFPDGDSRSTTCSVGVRYIRGDGLATFKWSSVTCPAA